MKYLIDPTLKGQGGGDCKKKGGGLCGPRIMPLYGVIVPD